MFCAPRLQVLRVRGLVDLRLQDPAQEKTRRFLLEKLFASVALARALSAVMDDLSALTPFLQLFTWLPKNRWSRAEDPALGSRSVRNGQRCARRRKSFDGVVCTVLRAIEVALLAHVTNDLDFQIFKCSAKHSFGFDYFRLSAERERGTE